MTALVVAGIIYWLAVLSAAKSVVGAVNGLSELVAPVQATALPRQGATFKRSPLADDGAFASPTLAPLIVPVAETVEPTPTPMAEVSPPPTLTAIPAATETVASELTVPPATTETPIASVAATTEPDVEPSPTTSGRPPRLSIPQPEPEGSVAIGSHDLTVRIRADADLAEVKAALDGERVELLLEPVGDGAWVLRAPVQVPAGRHRAWVRARDVEGREGSVAWEFEGV